ncbi:MAG TPA: universal stress protein [Roseiarcus sp.]|nr:universal stress protein [Roseiarcus sp.]
MDVTLTTLMVCLRLERPNAELLAVTADLAQRFRSGVIGVATRHPMQFMFTGGLVPEELVEQEANEFKEQVDRLEAEFRNALLGRAGKLQWRPKMELGPLSDYVANEARSADLVITEADQGGSFSHPESYLDVGDLLMRVGRPVLVAPTAASELKLERAVVGWKETPEARRAVFDALPLLKQAASVAVVEIAGEAELEAARFRLEDVVAWLGRHGVAAEPIAAPASGADASRLKAIAQEQGADLIVAGAFGHSRLREWVFGGVTKDLLLRSDQFTLLSH